MKIIFKATRIELSNELKNYAIEKLGMVDRLINEEGGRVAWAQVELEKTTEHHNLGPVFRAEVNLHVGGDYFRAETTADDLRSAIDLVKNELMRVLDSKRKKKETLIRRGGRTLKRFVRGAISWPPFRRR